VLCVLWVLEVLQIVEVGDKLWLVENLFAGQVMKIGGIREALDKLGAMVNRPSRRSRDG
jgi:hypothetical protein